MLVGRSHSNLGRSSGVLEGNPKSISLFGKPCISTTTTDCPFSDAPGLILWAPSYLSKNAVLSIGFWRLHFANLSYSWISISIRSSSRLWSFSPLYTPFSSQMGSHVCPLLIFTPRICSWGILLEDRSLQLLALWPPPPRLPSSQNRLFSLSLGNT